MGSSCGVLGRFASPYFVARRRRRSAYRVYCLASPASSRLVWLATRLSTTARTKVDCDHAPRRASAPLPRSPASVTTREMQLEILRGLADVDPSAWDTLVGAESAFLEWGWLASLEA